MQEVTVCVASVVASFLLRCEPGFQNQGFRTRFQSEQPAELKSWKKSSFIGVSSIHSQSLAINKKCLLPLQKLHEAVGGEILHVQHSQDICIIFPHPFHTLTWPLGGAVLQHHCLIFLLGGRHNQSVHELMRKNSEKK